MIKPAYPDEPVSKRGMFARLRGKAGRMLRMIGFRLRGKTRYAQAFYAPHLVEAVGASRPPSHICDHLGTMFFFTLDAKPRLIVELGTNQGESTRAFLAAAAMADATVLSIDKQDCSHLTLPFGERWHFVKSDDVEFARNSFTGWCRERSIDPVIDLLFIDTSHEYGHTKQEIETWTPYLSDHGTIIFHDTNMGTGAYGRLDGSVGFGYENDRGVIRAIEDMVGRRYDETTYFTDYSRGFLIMHHPNCNGLAVLKKGAADLQSQSKRPPLR